MRGRWIFRRGIALVAVAGVTAGVALLLANANAGRIPPGPPPSPQATSPSPELTAPSPRPSASPTRAGAWSELRWSQPSQIPDDAALLDVVRWHDAYVAAGDVAAADGHMGAAFISADGRTWQRTFTFPANPSIVATPTALVAVLNRRGTPQAMDAWTSPDGRSWQRDERLTLIGGSITALAAREKTILAMGTDAAGRPMMWRSVDSGAWSPIGRPSPRAIVRAVAAISDGFVAVGRDGEPDVASGGVGVRGVGKPAAWWSGDGGAWKVLQVQGVEAVGAELSGIFRVADGFFAIGSDTTTSGQSPRSPLLWFSADAMDWRMVGPTDHWARASANGQQAVIFAVADFGTVALGAWASQDGRNWNQLSFGGDVAEMPAFETAVGQSSRVERIFAEPNGIVVIGQRNGHLTAWFAEAVVR